MKLYPIQLWKSKQYRNFTLTDDPSNITVLQIFVYNIRRVLVALLCTYSSSVCHYSFI